MKFIFLLNTLIFPVLSIAEFTTTETVEPFVCDPPTEIRNRVNENCLIAIDNSIDYPREQSFSIPNGKVFFISTTTENGQTHFRISHKCNGRQRSQWRDFSFCGYQNFQLDRSSAPTRAVRKEIISEHRGWSEEKNKADIDRAMAQIIYPTLADPKANIREDNGFITIQILHQSYGTTCYGPQTIRYEPSCSR